jgi:heme-degrading monooxygenase HmoA
MIVRAWHGQASAANSLAYVEHFRSNVLPELRAISGFRGACLLREDRADEVEFVVLTKWVSMDAIRAFAGDDVSRAVVEPEAVRALSTFDATVRHYEIVDESSISG